MSPFRQSAVAGLILVFALIAGSSVQAALRETWYQESEPSWSQVERWKEQAPSQKKLRLKLEGTPSIELLPKLLAAGFTQIQILTSTYPTPSSVERWKELAGVGVELVTLAGALPTSTQIRLLNEIRFPRVLFVLTRYLEYLQENPFLRLEGRYDLHFALNRYPQYLQKFALADLPLEVGIQVTVDYWPRYVQMDILNLIPQMKQLRIQSIPISEGSIDYVNHLKNLQEIVFESDFEPPQSQWQRLAGVPVRWILKNRTPSESAVDLLSSQVSRNGMKFRLSLDLPRPIKPEEKAFYDTLPFDVEWTSDAP